MPAINLKILIRGAGELATGVAHCLSLSHFRVCMTEIDQPIAVRRGVSFSEAVYEGEKEVNCVVAELVSSSRGIWESLEKGRLPLLIDPEASIKSSFKPDVLVDATIAKKNLGTTISDAPLVIGLGVGFTAGKDVHLVIETNRGHNLGRIIVEGEAEPNTGIPGEIAGMSAERVLRAPEEGIFKTDLKIGEHVVTGDEIASVNGVVMKTKISGVIRGLLRNGTSVSRGLKAGDVDPRGIAEYCYTISDKARTIAAGVLESIIARFNI